ncbi:MAG TPA: S8/S53 family peptidase [Blastocatellia bacterium]|nr:S8/S53 family peptidase [Blastocatellia bacterium]
MNKKKTFFVATVGFMLLAIALWARHRVSATQTPNELPNAGITSANTLTLNLILNTEPTEAVVAEFARYGAVLDVISELDAVVLQTQEANLAGVRSLPQVVSAIPDKTAAIAPRNAARFVQPISGGRSTFNQDAINIADLGVGRVVSEDGDGVYVALIDTGLVPAWRSHLPKQRVNIGYARAFSEADRQGKGLGPGGSHAWETDPSSHGTFLAGMILGFDVNDPVYPPGAQGPVEGSAPAATLIPIRITNDEVFSTSSIVSRAIVYAASLKERSLSNHPLVICLAVILHDEPIVRAAINYAITHGLIVVAAAGNDGEEGMAYPAAYPEVISVGASGWIGQWQPGADGIPGNFWRSDDVPDPINAADFFITDYSSRQLPGQYLDVIAPGHLIFGPGQLPGGPPDHFFGGGTSAAVPHVAGIVALMAQKRPQLTQAEAEEILKHTAVPIGPGCRTVMEPINVNIAFPKTYCWGADATGAGLVDAQAALSATPSH